MNNSDITTPTIKDPTVEVDIKILEEIKHQAEQQVVLRCFVEPEQLFAQIRIWESTFLYDLHSDHTSKLLHTFDIPLQPKYKQIMGTAFFILVFSALPPKNCCTLFKMREQIPHKSKGFFTGTIFRNESDFYDHVEILY